MRTFSASGNGKSCLGPVSRPLTDSDQHCFPIFLCHIGVPTFSQQNKVIKVCPKYLLSKQIISALKTDKCRSVEIKRRTHVPGYEYDSGRVSTVCRVI